MPCRLGSWWISWSLSAGAFQELFLDWLVQCRALSPEDTELTDRMVSETGRNWLSGPDSIIKKTKLGKSVKMCI